MNSVQRLQRKIGCYRQEVPGYETNVSGVVHAILTISGKDWNHGYIIKDEVTMGSIGGVPLRLKLKRPDQAVFLEITYDDSEEPVLVIECKHHQQGDEFDGDDLAQLAKYIIGGGFPHGLLISEYSAIFYDINPTRTGIEVRGETLDTMDDLQTIVDIIREY